MSTYQPLRAAAWMMGSVVAFVGMGAAGRALKGHLDVFEILFYRSIMGVVIMVSIAALWGKMGDLRTRAFSKHLLRNTVHFMGQGLWFWALMIIPLAQLFAIEFTSPIWVMLLAPLLLGEALTRPRILAAALGFAGILFVARPDLSDLNPGVLAAAAAAIFFAGNVILTKRLTKGEAILGILFWQAVIQTGLGAVAVGWDGVVAVPAVAILPYLFIVGGGGLLGHLCLTKALSLAPTTFVMPMDFVRLPVAVAMGAIFYGEGVELAIVVGAALIFLGNWINIRYGAK